MQSFVVFFENVKTLDSKIPSRPMRHVGIDRPNHRRCSLKDVFERDVYYGPIGPGIDNLAFCEPTSDAIE